MVKDAQLASDLAQEIFLKIYKKLETYRGNAKLSTWIYKIATNAYLDYFRTAAPKKRKSDKTFLGKIYHMENFWKCCRNIENDKKA